MRYLITATLVVIFTATACSAPTPPPSPGNNNSQFAPTSQAASATAVPPPDAQVQPTTGPSATPSRQPSVTPLPTLTPVPAQLIQLMDGGCCASPGWYLDSETILYIDKPTADAPVGIYGLNINTPNKSELWSELIAFYTRDFDYAQIPERNGTRLIRVSDGAEIRVPNRGRQVQFSPDRTRVVWTETRDTFPTENRVGNILLADIDFDEGTVGEPRQIAQILRGGVSGWLDDNRLLMNGRLNRESNDSTTFVHDLMTGERTEIYTAERSRLTTLSRDGAWIAYVIVNDKDPERNGLWVERTDGTDERKVELFGAAQWRDDTHLIIAPFEMGAASHAFYEYDAETGATRRLTPPTDPFFVASGDWTISPDGDKIVFVNAADNNIWLWKLGE